MANPPVIPNYGPKSAAKHQRETRGDEDELLQEELRWERESQVLEEVEQEPPRGPMEAQAAQEDSPLNQDNTWTQEQRHSLQLMLDAGYTWEESVEALRQSIPEVCAQSQQVEEDDQGTLSEDGL